MNPRRDLSVALSGNTWRTAVATSVFAVMLIGSLSGAVLSLATTQPSPPPPLTAGVLNKACVEQDRVALDRLVALANGKTDAELRQVPDTVFVIRRARRYCAAGFVQLALGDYRAIAARLPRSHQ